MNTLRSDFEAAVLEGEEYLSDWHVITQQMVDEYAALTGDGEGEWVHLDPDRAAQGGYGGTIVQGFLQVSHLIKLHAQAVKARPKIDKNFALNYGFDRLRFVGQMPVGARFRARVGARELIQKPGDALILKQEVKLELEDGRPTLVADWLFYLDARAFGEG